MDRSRIAWQMMGAICLIALIALIPVINNQQTATSLAHPADLQQPATALKPPATALKPAIIAATVVPTPQDTQEAAPQQENPAAQPPQNKRYTEQEKADRKAKAEAEVSPAVSPEAARKDLEPRNTGCYVAKTREACCAAIDSRYEIHGGTAGGSPCMPSVGGSTFASGNNCEPENWASMHDPTRLDSCNEADREARAQQRDKSAQLLKKAKEASLEHSSMPGVAATTDCAAPGIQGGDLTKQIVQMTREWSTTIKNKPRLLCYVMALAREAAAMKEVTQPVPVECAVLSINAAG